MSKSKTKPTSKELEALERPTLSEIATAFEEPNGDLKIQYFMAGMSQQLDFFRKYWTENNKHDPDQWPLQMGVADWFDQFVTFLETQK